MPVQNTQANREKCICPKCPSYPSKCKGELLYCSTGKSDCEIDAKGCICPFCPVYAENKLNRNYFCDKEFIGENNVYMRKKKADELLSFYRSVADIKNMAAGGKSIVRSMGSQKILPFSLGDLHFVPAQVYKVPLNKEQSVNTHIVIGPSAKKPLRLSSPIIISGMSYGATSKNVRLVISGTAAKLKIGFNSGEGGILEEESKIASSYLIAQYATGRFGIDEKILKKAAAIEIRFGQGAYPGKGSYLPANKMTDEIAKLRGLKKGEAAYSPAHHTDIQTPLQIKQKVLWLKKITAGVPIGAKIGCGNIENDVNMLARSGVDFISLDGFGGGTGATDFYVRENVGLPIVAALPRASRQLKKIRAKNRISLIAGGGLRTSADFAKCLALGADAIYAGTAALIAINCEQYRICHTGLCPTGVTTHDPTLIKQLDIEKGIERLLNFIEISTEEIASLTRIVGKNDVKDLNISDLVSLKKDLSLITQARWLNGKIG